MQQAKFRIGDVVKLKSGGPDMTIESVHDGKYECVWFEALDVFREYFPEESLEVSETNSHPAADGHEK